MQRFAAREADHRLQKLVEQFKNPPQIRVLDLGCAAGRNTVFLCELGFNVWAVDASQPMIKKTKERLSTVLANRIIEERILLGAMHDLRWAADDYFDLVLALGIYHNAQSEDEFRKALRETARVTKRNGIALVANFAPGFAPQFQELRKVENSRFLYENPTHGNMCLLTADELDREMASVGFFPKEPSATVQRTTQTDRRVTVNAIYEKRR